MGVLTDKHGNTLRSVNSQRLDYLMSYEEFSLLVSASSHAQSKTEARVECTKVWKQLGDKYGFDYKSVHRPKNGNKNPRAFSAIPLSNGEDVSESVGEEGEGSEDSKE